MRKGSAVFSSVRLLSFTRGSGIQRCACASSCAQQEGAGALVASRPDNLKAIRSSLAAACLTRKIFKNWSLSLLTYITLVGLLSKTLTKACVTFPLPSSSSNFIAESDSFRNYIYSILVSRTFERLDRPGCVNVACRA